MTPGAAVRVPRLHLVTDDETLARPHFLKHAVAVMQAAGSVSSETSADVAPTVAVHVRGPRTSGRRVYDVARALSDGARANGTMLVVNDRVGVALSLDGVGVHLGVRSLALTEVCALLDARGVVRPLGVSCHAPDDAASASRAGADWVFAGHVFETASHPGLAGRGTEWLRTVVDAAEGLPVLGIGGITPDRVAGVVAAGAAGVAVLGGVWNAPDPVDAVLEYIQVLNA